MQFDPMKPTLNATETKRLNLYYDRLLSSFAFNVKLRRYNAGDAALFLWDAAMKPKKKGEGGADPGGGDLMGGGTMATAVVEAGGGVEDKQSTDAKSFALVLKVDYPVSHVGTTHIGWSGSCEGPSSSAMKSGSALDRASAAGLLAHITKTEEARTYMVRPCSLAL